MGEASEQIENLTTKPLDAVVVCGMGPVALRETRTLGSDDVNLVAANFMNFLNGVSANLIMSHGAAETVILSGYKSQNANIDNPSPLQILEKTTSEADLLDNTLMRARPKGLTDDEKQRISDGDRVILEQDARTTFGNIIQALNLLDKKTGGHWEGSFAVLSSEFHGPRIREMLDAFGLKDSKILSAERILKRFGYTGRLHPITDKLTGKPWEEFEEIVYKGQPAGLQNLQDNPSYVTFELANITSDKRLQEMAQNLKQYYADRNVGLPEVYGTIPKEYDPTFDYNGLRERFRSVVFSKHPYTGVVEKEESVPYRQLAAIVGEETEKYLDSLNIKL